MPDRQTLLQQASQCRRLAESQTDPHIKGELLKLAVEFEEKARDEMKAPKKSD